MTFASLLSLLVRRFGDRWVASADTPRGPTRRNRNELAVRRHHTRYWRSARTHAMS